MPSTLLAADTNFPNLEGKGSVEEKLSAVSSYLYLLLENLRYTLSNLGAENFNDTELSLLSQTLTQPVEIKIKDVEGNVAQLTLSAEELATKVESAEGAASEAKQTADSLTVKFQSQSGQLTQIRQSIDGLNITQKSGGTALSGVSLYFYDGATRSADYGPTIGYESGLGNIIGQMAIDDNGDGSDASARYRLFVGTGRGVVGMGEVGYPLKLQSAGDSSYVAYGNIYIQPGEMGGKNATNYVYIGDGETSKKYEFRSDGIYYGSKRIVDSTKTV